MILPQPIKLFLCLSLSELEISKLATYTEKGQPTQNKFTQISAIYTPH